MSLCLGRKEKTSEKDEESKPGQEGLGALKWQVGLILGLEGRLLSVGSGFQFEFKVILLAKTET